MKKPAKLITSVLAGITLGLLFAPKKGTDFRKELSKSDDKIGTIGKELLAFAKDASKEVQKFLDRKEVKDLIDTGKAHLSDLYEVSKDKGSELSESAKAELEDLAKNLSKKAKTVKKTANKKAKDVKKKVSKKVKDVKKKVSKK